MFMPLYLRHLLSLALEGNFPRNRSIAYDLFIHEFSSESRSIGHHEVSLRISQNIHNMMFNGIISTSMRFFDTNPSGRILNRFSKDLG